MQKHGLYRVTLVLTAAGLLGTGCSSNMAGKATGGAFTGALSASFVGAMTDLVLHGKVNTDRLVRNATSGAIAGGVAGAAYGHQQDVRTEQQRQARTAPPPAQDPGDKELMKQIGPDNFDALVNLLYGRHESAFAGALKAAESKKLDYVEAAYAIQALIDLDRKNDAGVTQALDAFVKLSAAASDMGEVRDGLNDLHRELVVARRIKGIPGK